MDSMATPAEEQLRIQIQVPSMKLPSSAISHPLSTNLSYNRPRQSPDLLTQAYLTAKFRVAESSVGRNWTDADILCLVTAYKECKREANAGRKNNMVSEIYEDGNANGGGRVHESIEAFFDRVHGLFVQRAINPQRTPKSIHEKFGFLAVTFRRIREFQEGQLLGMPDGIGWWELPIKEQRRFLSKSMTPISETVYLALRPIFDAIEAPKEQSKQITLLPSNKNSGISSYLDNSIRSSPSVSQTQVSTPLLTPFDRQRQESGDQNTTQRQQVSRHQEDADLFLNSQFIQRSNNLSNRNFQPTSEYQRYSHELQDQVERSSLPYSPGTQQIYSNQRLPPQDDQTNASEDHAQSHLQLQFESQRASPPQSENMQHDENQNLLLGTSQYFESTQLELDSNDNQFLNGVRQEQHINLVFDQVNANSRSNQPLPKRRRIRSRASNNIVDHDENDGVNDSDRSLRQELSVVQDNNVSATSMVDLVRLYKQSVMDQERMNEQIMGSLNALSRMTSSLIDVINRNQSEQLQ
ncbi:hypothetical protein V1514DRAFT_326710 [Lipomyces japonicus]|uniref:uncharacterized protein n=1 Tax=Lipomyces japonicus TaxID=56871 RepID=UPI0034CD066D